MIYIKRPIRPKFVARVREPGHHLYEVIGEFDTSKEAAMCLMSRFAGSDRFKRGDVLMIEDWYEPNQLMEVTR